MTSAFTVTGSQFRRRSSLPAAYSGAATDEMLVERLANGDQLAMRTLFARHQTRVYRFVLRLVKNEATAEDILSDVFLDVWRQASRFQGRASVSTWLFAIARFKALSTMRRRMDLELDDNMTETIADPADDPEMALQHKNTAEVLRQGLANLSPIHAEVLDLVYYHGKSVKEAGEITGVSEATVKTRMFYARRKLAEFLFAK
jgi:RNA polymerase sigma-70 factor (ECF subfamily)